MKLSCAALAAIVIAGFAGVAIAAEGPYTLEVITQAADGTLVHKPLVTFDDARDCNAAMLAQLNTSWLAACHEPVGADSTHVPVRVIRPPALINYGNASELFIYER